MRSFELQLIIKDIVPKQVRIDSQGTLTYREGDQTLQSKIPGAELDRFIALTVKNDFFTLEPPYDDDFGVMDGVSFILTITLDDRSHTYTSEDCWGEDETSGFNNIIEALLPLIPKKIEIIGYA